MNGRQYEGGAMMHVTVEGAGGQSKMKKLRKISMNKTACEIWIANRRSRLWRPASVERAKMRCGEA